MEKKFHLRKSGCDGYQHLNHRRGSPLILLLVEHSVDSLKYTNER